MVRRASIVIDVQPIPNGLKKRSVAVQVSRAAAAEFVVRRADEERVCPRQAHLWRCFTTAMGRGALRPRLRRRSGSSGHTKSHEPTYRRTDQAWISLMKLHC